MIFSCTCTFPPCFVKKSPLAVAHTFQPAIKRGSLSRHNEDLMWKRCFTKANSSHEFIWRISLEKTQLWQERSDAVYRLLFVFIEISLDACASEWAVNEAEKKGDNVLSPLVLQMVHQWVWRQSIVALKPHQFLNALQELLERWEKWDKVSSGIVKRNASSGMWKTSKRHEMHFGPRASINCGPV